MEVNQNILSFIKMYNQQKIGIFEYDLQLKDLISLLENRQLLFQNRSGNLVNKNQNKLFIGQLSARKKFGFVNFNNEDIFIPDTNGYFDGDIVVGVINNFRKDRKNEGQLISMVARDDKMIILKVLKEKNLVPIDENLNMHNFVLSEKLDYDLINERQVIQCSLVKTIRNKTFVEFKKVITDLSDPDMDMKIVLANYNIVEEFSQETETQIENINEVDTSDYENRIDLRNMLTCTIDGADAKDLDDAVSLIKESNGYRLYVSIADVSHYVEENTPLDKDAFSRSTSVYFVDRVVPMIPKKLSNGICSLHPNVDRLTLTCEMLINDLGHVVDIKIYPSVINSDFRLTYDQVNEMIYDNKFSEEHAIIYSVMKEADKLRGILNKKRLNRGSFNFEDNDSKFVVNEDGKITDILPFERRNAEKLIEEFMIVANETVAETIHWLEMPFIYRVHDKPNPNKLKEVMLILQQMDITVKGNIEDVKPSMFKSVFDQVEGDINKRIISDLLIRSMSKAVYSDINIGHFGLASNYYTHFTSPIRRYPDLIVHRYLRKYLFDNVKINYEKEKDFMHYASGYTSDKEVKAMRAENTIEDMKKAEYMNQFIGTEYVGYVASIMDFGFFIELDNSISGLIKFKTIKDFKKVIHHQIHIGNDKVTIGDKLNVRVISTNYQRGIVDFELVDYETAEAPVFKSYANKRKERSGRPGSDRRKQTNEKRGENRHSGRATTTSTNGGRAATSTSGSRRNKTEATPRHDERHVSKHKSRNKGFYNAKKGK